MTAHGKTLLERWVARVQVTDSCWLWTGAVDNHGYGRFKTDGRVLGAHRVGWTLIRGPIDDELTLDHLCRVRHCVNPAHLEPVSGIENTLRGMSRNAINARKTECLRGHPFTIENTLIRRTGKGKRDCRACAAARARARGTRPKS